ncbi:MAG: YggT family protein [Deltaproteobacteria bacterium]|nr:YggT family protein [Deltaproteobacteria bacterium]
MFVLANFINAVAMLLDNLIGLYILIIFITVLISWVRPDPYNPIVRILHQITEPVLGFVRKKLPYMGPVDLSPLIVILVLLFVKSFLVVTLKQVAMKMAAG